MAIDVRRPGPRRGRYSYQLADLLTGAVLDELPLQGVSFSTVLNDAGELRAQLVLGDPRVDRRQPRLLAEPGRTALYVDRDGVLVWGGVLWTARYSSAGRTLELGAAGFLSYFDHRRVLPPDFDPALDDLDAVEVAFTDADQAGIVRALVTGAQAHPAGDIGVSCPAPPGAVITRSVTYPGSRLKNVGEALRELAALEDGPDLRFDVDYGPDGRPARTLQVGAPRLGQQGDPHVWEYGANLVEYAWPQDAASSATRVFVLGQQQDDHQLVAVEQATPAGRPLTETELSSLDVADPDRLSAQARAALATLGRPVVLPELTVRADVEPVLGSYDVGDTAIIVIKDHFFPDGTQFTVRLVGIEVTPGDDAGEELVKLTISPEGEGSP